MKVWYSHIGITTSESNTQKNPDDDHIQMDLKFRVTWDRKNGPS